MIIKTFDDVRAQLQHRNKPKRVAVVMPHDESTRTAVEQGAQEGWMTPVFFSNSDARAAADAAVRAVRQGQADVLMKGLVQSDVLLRAILHRDTGIMPVDGMLTHLAIAQIPDYHKLLFFTDAAVIPRPTDAQRVLQVQAVVDLCHRCGVDEPRVSLIHCSEKVDERHFPYTAHYKEVIAMAQQGAFGSCVVDGPLDLKTSCSSHSLHTKGIASPIGGEADALVFPDIEAGNLFYKTITLFSSAVTAGLLHGAAVPVVMPSRADSATSKYLSLCIACL